MKLVGGVLTVGLELASESEPLSDEVKQLCFKFNSKEQRKGVVEGAISEPTVVPFGRSWLLGLSRSFSPSLVGDEGEGGRDGVSRIEVKAVLTLTVGLKELSSSVTSLPFEFSLEIATALISFLPNPNNSLADLAKSFSTLGVRRTCRFFRRSEPPDDKDTDRTGLD